MASIENSARPQAPILSNTVPSIPSDDNDDNKIHLLLAASGSVATIKIPNILHALSHHPNLAIRLIFTKSAINFLGGQSAEQPYFTSLSQIKNVESIFLDDDEWDEPWKRGNDILHISLRRWAHIMVVCPLSANTLAKIVGGISDNLLTSVIRAWDTTGEVGQRKKRIVVAPAMNTAMWNHPVTKKQIAVLEQEWGIRDGAKENEYQGWFEVLRPMEKELACGDVGDGAMKDWKEIVGVIEARLGLGQSS